MRGGGSGFYAGLLPGLFQEAWDFRFRNLWVGKESEGMDRLAS